VHTVPSPLNPGLHAHVNEPILVAALGIGGAVVSFVGTFVKIDTNAADVAESRVAAQALTKILVRK